MQTRYIYLMLLVAVGSSQCNKIKEEWIPGKGHGYKEQTRHYSSEVASEWMGMQIELMKAQPTATGNAAFSRHYAYAGITLYEAVVPGMPDHRSLAGQLNGLNGIPKPSAGISYHWALSANAALAEITRKFYSHVPNAETQITALEASLSERLAGSSSKALLQRSIEFGKSVATKIFDWSETDGYQAANNPFSAPASKTGAGFWAPPTPSSVQSLPFWKNQRRMVSGSDAGAELPPPPVYSTHPSSAFYKMAKEVYDASPAAGSPERAMAFYWRDVPGTTTPGHYISILKQVLDKDRITLDKAALAFAMGGIMVYDAGISTWETKYKYWLVRPVTYIQQVLGHTGWVPTLGTPPHPEYPSAHSSLSAANAEALTIVFGDNYAFVDHTFDYLHNAGTDPLLFKARSYPSFRAIALEAGESRLYGGIHYRYSIEQGLRQGWKVAHNINKRLRFK